MMIRILIAALLLISFSSSAFAADDAVLICGGKFTMGSPESEGWRSDDETEHEVAISDFYIMPREATQAEWNAVMPHHDFAFAGDELPIESITWREAIEFCNAKSVAEGLTPAYKIDGDTITWDRSADGWRLPTESEWEYAARAGSSTPFSGAGSIGASDANFYGHYPYNIEQNYFTQEKLDVKPGQYRATTLAPGSFAPNAAGLYDVHGNVGEWCWDTYGDLSGSAADPTGAADGTRKVARGGGWNDFAKHMRCAYRASMPPDRSSASVGVRLARNAAAGSGLVVTQLSAASPAHRGGKIFLAYFSWGGTTRGIAQEIAKQAGTEIFEISPAKEYSSDYSTVLEEAQRDQREQARPELRSLPADLDDYDILLIGYPNWWASIPMPIASFLEHYDFSGKTIVPFCSHGGGRLGQSITAISKLAPNAQIGEPLSVHYSGGASLPRDISAWLAKNGIER